MKELPHCIHERVFFTRGVAAPHGEMTFVLDRMADAMRETDPDVELVEVRGYRSGAEAASVSRQRAASVHAALLSRGVRPERLVVVDGGLLPPREARNGQHRVELWIAKQRFDEQTGDQIVCTPMGRYHKRVCP